MPPKTLTALSVLSVALLAGYIALVATAMFFATLRTELTAELQEAETRIGALETRYYDAIAELNATDVFSIGYVAPLEVGYIAQNGTPVVTRADR
jgi:hypothetical protein